MLPLQQAYEVRSAIEEYLKATFTFSSRAVDDAFNGFINHPEQGLFKGPYVSVKLPFLSAPANAPIPLEIAPGFTPYRHQQLAFERLTTLNGHKPQPSLITTGTSSGKTECFLYPVLDYCYRQQHRPGIKAIILYPMNALATDQAKRLAEIIWNDDRLKGKVTAGLFIGEGGAAKPRERDMGPANIIEDRKSIYQSPPDILLTNFKMLDFGLMKGLYDSLWHFNYNDTGLLQYLVLDELHTYDGAQGTDVANLIRRLKLKLTLPDGQLCPVGTSATIGSGAGATGLVEYAAQVFGQAIAPDAMIGEERLSVAEYLPHADDPFFPAAENWHLSKIGTHEDYPTYLQRQAELWQLPPGSDPADWPDILKGWQIVKGLLQLTGEGVLHFAELVNALADRHAAFASVPEYDAALNYFPREQLLQSLLTLLSAARVLSGEHRLPFVYVQVQLWVREMSGVHRYLQPTPAFGWKQMQPAGKEPLLLPPWYCRECGGSGWLGIKNDIGPLEIIHDSNSIYQHFFAQHKNLYLLLPAHEPAIEEYRPTSIIQHHVHMYDGSLQSAPSNKTIPIIGYRQLRADNQTKCNLTCPCCNSNETLTIIGTRVATLSSITVSQVLSSNLDAAKPRQRKILAFTNSVQDAAHQAGFVEARNYRFTFRSSLQQVLNQLQGPATLAEVQQYFTAYWKQHADETGNSDIEAYIYRFFPEDLRGKINLERDYRYDRGKPFKPHFLPEFDLRMGWEVASEFGYNARIGRTLEKTGASAVQFDQEKIEAVFPALADWLGQNRLGVIQPDAFTWFLHGLLHRMRIRGAVHHPFFEKYRSGKLNRWDLNWNNDGRHFLNRYFGPKARYPKMVVHTAHPPENADNSYTQSDNWFHAYFRKSFPMADRADNRAIVNEFYGLLWRLLTQQGLLHEMRAGAVYNYALHPEAIVVENKVASFACSKCNSKLFTTPGNPYALGTPCLDYRCDGQYQQLLPDGSNYYQRVYNRTYSPRIYAAEHTGLLPRDHREKIEYQFKERPVYDSLNALVATSTLEMGINIGTLNAAINNSVPPKTANFVQRVGRAGRASGAALITNFALHQHHDQYYFAEPLAMMLGQIEVPGCFLEAKEILGRHFLAACFDAWAAADPKENRLPEKIGRMKLLFTDLQDPSFVVNRFLGFVKANEGGLLQRFKAIFEKDNIPDAIFTELATTLHTETWYSELRQVFVDLKAEMLDLLKKAGDIELLIKARGLAPTDAAYKELHQEKRAILGIKKIIGNRSPIEHLTNRGFLPNYAFPETGVKLQASIRAMTAKESDAPPLHEEFEIVRDAATALKELAPHNDFYAMGYRFHISGLNTYDWKDAANLRTMRFCSQCDHLAPDIPPVAATCPKCGDPGWGASSNRHIYVKLQGVRSNNLRQDALLDDSREERPLLQYRRSRHLFFDSQTSQGAYGMVEIPFGIEYVKNIRCTEVNMGLGDVRSSNTVNINQMTEVPRHGFITCRHCGKSHGNPNLVDPTQPGPQNQWHFAWCPHRDENYTGVVNEVFEEVYLFREVNTEALKILLPVQDFDTEENIQMFSAGIKAALRLYFKGSPDHIRTWDYREFNTNTQRFDRYLVLYDSIPGGTGYLQKLFDKEAFTKLLVFAWQHLKNCACQYQGNDGCYRCIYDYGNQYVRESLSRSKAEQLFEKLVQQGANWQYLQHGLGSLSGTGQIEESELEDRFIRSLKNVVKQKELQGWHWHEERKGTVRYQLTLVAGDESLSWQITPQKSLGATQGLSFSTRVDFECVLIQYTKDGIIQNDPELLDEAPRWLVYLDGYDFHGSAQNCRFYTDLSRRLAIAQTPTYRSYTLTWYDLDRFDHNLNTDKNNYKRDGVDCLQDKYANTRTSLKNHPAFDASNSELAELPDAMFRFLWFLSHPFKEHNLSPKTGFVLAMMQQQLAFPSFDVEEIPAAMFAPNALQSSATRKTGGKFFILSEASVCFPFACLKIGINMKDFSQSAGITWNDTIRSIDKEAWASFWPVFNLVQHATEIIRLEPEMEESVIIQQDDLGAEWRNFYAEDLQPIVERMLQAGCLVNPEGDFFLEEKGFPPATAELGHHHKKWFIRAISPEDKDVFLKAGYTEITIETFTNEMI